MSCEIVLLYEEASISNFVQLPKATTLSEAFSTVRDNLSEHVSKRFGIAEEKVAEGRLSEVNLYTEKGFILNHDVASLGDLGCDRIFAIVSSPLKHPHVDPHPDVASTPLLDYHRNETEAAREDAARTSELAIDEFKRQIKAVEQEVETFKKELESQKASNKETKRTVKDWEKGNQALRADMEVMKKAYDELKERYNELKDDNNQLTQKVEYLEKEIEDILGSLDDQVGWNLEGPSAARLEKLALRRLLDVAQAHLAKVAKLKSPTSQAWREHLHGMTDVERIAYTKKLFSDTPDKKVRRIISSDDAVGIVTQHYSEVRDEGNSAAHSSPKQVELKPLIEKHTKAGRNGIKTLSDNFAA